ncbi:MAG: RAMP superfamily CRISPR-associated protein, partial [Acidimicrobiales bacterium]
LRTAEVLHRGAVLHLALVYDPLPTTGGGDEPAPRPLSADDLAELAAWRPMLGGSRTSGLGRTTQTRLYRRTLALSDDDDLLAWLQLGGMDTFRKLVTTPVAAPPSPRTRPSRRWRLQVQDALFTAGRPGAPADGEAADQVNRAPFQRIGDQLVIAGSSLKGALRSRAEFITRTRGEPICDPASAPCGTCTICTLFGSPARRGKLAVHDAPLIDPVTADRTHVAIDRFTGGAADRRLYTHEVVINGCLDLVVDALSELSAHDNELLEAVMADIDAGYVGIGAGVTRGYGTVEVIEGAGRG